MIKPVRLRVLSLAVAAILTSAFAAEGLAEAVPSTEKGQTLACQVLRPPTLTECYAAAREDEAKLARCDALPSNPITREPARPAEPLYRCEKVETPRSQLPLRPTPEQVDKCYAWAGEDDARLSACDEMSNGALRLLSLERAR